MLKSVEMINKRTLYESLYKSFYPKSIVAFATTNGYRVCKDDPQMVDYDILYAIDSGEESKTWVQITSFTATPRISFRINELHIEYALGTAMVDLVDLEGSFNGFSQDELDWINKAYTAINQAFADAGYVL